MATTGSRTRKRDIIKARAKEPSTWAGLSILAGLFGVQVAPDHIDAVLQTVAGVAAVASVLIPERK